MESLSCFEDVQGEVDLWTVPLPLDAVEGILQIEPKADLLQSSTTGRITLKTSHLFMCVQESEIDLHVMQVTTTALLITAQSCYRC